ncbi:MAG TPA: ATP-binding protein [Polyangia bacterium]|nr:ATP-binding protein [Polyangia bacterium]
MPRDPQPQTNRVADPFRRVRRRVLLLSAPLVFIFALTDRMVLRGWRFWEALGIRFLWGVTLVGAALWLPRLRPTGERRVLTAVGFTTPLFFCALALMTGGMKSPLFHFIVAMPLIVAVVLQDQPPATLAAAVAMLAGGLTIVGVQARSAALLSSWLVQAGALGGLAVYASVTYRRLRLHLQAARTAEVEASQRARLFQTELKAREEFLSLASHELKTPMTSLLLYVDSLRRMDTAIAAPDGSRWRTVADKHRIIARQTRRLASLTDSLLDASRIQAGKLQIEPQDADLVAIVEACVLSFEEDARLAGSTIQLSVDGVPLGVPLDPDAPAPNGGRPRIGGWWDPRRLEQILGNVLANAIRYGAGNPIQVETDATGDRVVIVVRDHGVGIPADEQGRIFERFTHVSTEKVTGGLGLGLWLTERLVQGMGGRVLLTSAPGQGATFTVELPRRTVPATVRVSS